MSNDETTSLIVHGDCVAMLKRIESDLTPGNSPRKLAWNSETRGPMKRHKQNTRGPKAVAPLGYGRVTKNGYRRIWSREHKKLKMEHVLVWERANGPIAKGLQVHHIDGDKLNNDIVNLELLDALTHKRLHGGCELRNGVWWKPCGDCKAVLDVPTNYYVQTSGAIASYCKKCIVVRNSRARRKRKAARP